MVTTPLLIVLAMSGWYIVQLRAENAALKNAMIERAQQSPRAAPPKPVTGGRTLTAEQRKAMLDALGGGGVSTERPVWFATVANNPEAVAFERVLESVFEEAGWQVRANTVAKPSIKPGIFFFMADEDPPPHVLAALDAFNTAGIAVTAGRGYRAFYAEKKRANPDWTGFELKPDQDFIIVIGRQPED